MSELVFVDTNVFVYRLDATEAAKQPVAQAWVEALWRSRAGRLSTQVLQEFYQTVTRKLSPGLSREEARGELRDLATWQPATISPELLDVSFGIEDQFALSFWDSLIVAAAKQLSCRYLLTEDLQDGQDLAGLRIVDPFEHEPIEFGFGPVDSR